MMQFNYNSWLTAGIMLAQYLEIIKRTYLCFIIFNKNTEAAKIIA